MWGDLKEPQRAAWLAVMRATLSTEGYRRVVDEWRADDALARESGAGRGPDFGMGFYWIALIGDPSETQPWQWQWGGHHVTLNATVAGPHVSLTPSFIGVQPATFTDASGAAVRPLGDIERDAFALMNWLDADQQRAASLAKRPADVVLGPGEDGKTIAPAGLPAARMSEDQRAALMRLIGHYSGLANDEDAAERMSEIRAGLDQTYFAWNGPTTSGAAVYFRVTGPAVVIEYSAQEAVPVAARNRRATFTASIATPRTTTPPASCADRPREEKADRFPGPSSFATLLAQPIAKARISGRRLPCGRSRRPRRTR